MTAHSGKGAGDDGGGQQDDYHGVVELAQEADPGRGFLEFDFVGTDRLEAARRAYFETVHEVVKELQPRGELGSWLD